jgi:hypothetical protein
MRFLAITVVAVLTFASHHVSAFPSNALKQVGGSLQELDYLSKRGVENIVFGITE